MAAIYRQSWTPFTMANDFWMIPFLVPFLGSIIAVSVYSLLIERLALDNNSADNNPSKDFPVKNIGA